MRSNDILFEWEKCRDTIERFDGYLLQIRLLGASVFTILFTAITAAAASVNRLGISLHKSLLFALIALILFVVSVYILDRYYERMLLVAVLRAFRLEMHQLEGFKIGLTTEIESQKAEWNSSFAKASLMINIVYVLMLSIIIIEYVGLTWDLNTNCLYSLIFFFFVTLALVIGYIFNSLLTEPNRLIRRRAALANSPIIFSKNEIEAAISQIALLINDWLEQELQGARVINVVSILTGARQFTDSLMIKIKEHNPNINLRLHPIRVKSTENNSTSKESEILYGHVVKELMGGNPTIIIDDLVDTGKTLECARDIVDKAGVAKIKTVTLINKYKIARGKVDFVGFNMNLEDKVGLDYWLFGFGMDIDGEYREIEHISGRIKFSVGQQIKAKVISIAGNRVSYEILGGIHLTDKKLKNLAKLKKDQVVTIKVKALEEDGSIKSITLIEDSQYQTKSFDGSN
jgi:hypoxanthine phosphoribosyltransferase